MAMTFTDRDYRTAHLLNQWRGKTLHDEYTALGAFVTAGFTWPVKDSIAFDEFIDTVALAARCDELRAVWREEARNYLVERGVLRAEG